MSEPIQWGASREELANVPVPNHRTTFSVSFSPREISLPNSSDPLFGVKQKAALEKIRAEIEKTGGPQRLQKLLGKAFPPRNAPPAQPEPEVDKDVENLIKTLQSEVGYLFLDRTRIEPVGFSVGEHVYTLSLAPGEEVVIEQKTFSKKQTSFEEQNERESQSEMELSSTLSTELQDGLEKEKSGSSSSTASLNAGVGAPAGPANVNVSASVSRSVSSAHQETMNSSVKDAESKTTKLSSKYRSLHKVTFKVSSEAGFESSSKRLIRNPNRFTPVDLHYFKVMRKIKISQERVGVRLCWAPSVVDPGFGLFDRIQKGRQEIIDRLLAAVPLPGKPIQPVKRTASPKTSTGEVNADQWRSFGMQDVDYTIRIPIDPGYVWDNDKEYILRRIEAVTSNFTRGYRLIPIPDSITASGDHIFVTVRVLTAPILLGENGEIRVKATARFLPKPDTADPGYLRDYDEWKKKNDLWIMQSEELIARARPGALAAADAWQQEALASADPVAELMASVIKFAFSAPSRDESWEIDLWKKMFDWESASFTLHPSWWSDRPQRSPVHGPVHFFNASWGRLYLPVRIGFEQMALRWIYGRVVDRPLDPNKEAAITGVVSELNTFRNASFGAAELNVVGGVVTERVIPMASWFDSLPTDGTHIEVTQSPTSGMDIHSKGESDDADALRDAMVANRVQEAELKKKAVQALPEQGRFEVRINTDAYQS